ncbi:hypothetical protein HY989_04190 [Candidatus Micrarchaeota archaeon]|nr:hypothetical protein [Candidatus Micrarchaeota archaeon]
MGNKFYLTLFGSILVLTVLFTFVAAEVIANPLIEVSSDILEVNGTNSTNMAISIVLQKNNYLGDSNALSSQSLSCDDGPEIGCQVLGDCTCDLDENEQIGWEFGCLTDPYDAAKNICTTLLTQLPGATYTGGNQGTYKRCGLGEALFDFSWTPSYCQANSVYYRHQIKCEAASVPTIYGSVDFYVHNVNRNPRFLERDPNIVVTVTSPLVLSIDVEDPDNNQCSDSQNKDTLTITKISGLGQFTQEGETYGTYSWTPSFGDPDTNVVQFQVSDGKGGIDTDTKNIKVRKPVVSITPAYRPKENIGVIYTVNCKWSPESPSLPICLKASPEDFPPGSTYLDYDRSGLGSVNYNFQWTPDYCQADLLTSPTFFCGPTCDQSMIFASFPNRVDNNNRLPTLTLDQTSPMKVYSDWGTPSFSINVQATDPDTTQCSDPDNKDVLTLSLVKKPSFITGTFAINPDNTGTFTGHALSTGTGTIEFQVDDHRGGIVKKSLTINAVRLCSEYKITDIQNDAPFEEPKTGSSTRFKTIVTKTSPKPTITYSISPIGRKQKSIHGSSAFISHPAPTYSSVRTSAFGGVSTTISDYLGFTQPYVFEIDTHGPKVIAATAKWKVPEARGGYCQTTYQENLNVFFDKEKTDYSGLPNWFVYWSAHDDNAVFVKNPITLDAFDHTKKSFAYSPGSGWGSTAPSSNPNQITLMPKAAKELCIAQTISFVPELSGVINYKGIDNLACVIYHEGCHLKVWQNWKTAPLLGGWKGKADNDCDGIPNDVETSYSMNPDSPDSARGTYPYEVGTSVHYFSVDNTHACKGLEVFTTDEEIYCDIFAKKSVNKDLALGNNIDIFNDWATPGKQTRVTYKRISNETGTNATIGSGLFSVSRDTNGNSLFDFIEFYVPVNVYSPGTYTVEGALRSTYGDLIPATNFTYINNAINYYVRLKFDGKAIRQSRINGTYNISSLFLFGNHTQDSRFEIRSGLNYSYTSFEKFGSEIVAISSGVGIDSNQNGLFDYLLVTVDLDLVNQSNYTLTGELNLNGPTISSAINKTYLSNGTRKINLYFDGKEIYSKRLNGPYNISLVKLFDVLGNQLDFYPINVLTAPYSFNQFEKPAMYFTGQFLENSINFNKDAGIDALRLNLTVNISLAGTYFISGVLADSNFDAISDNLSVLNLTPGVKSIILDFNGFDIGESGLNGPYTFSITATDENGTTLGTFPPVNFTQEYNYTQFEHNFNPVTGCNPINESGLWVFIDNVTCNGNYIDITADNVVLDCNGFYLNGNISVNYPGIALQSNNNMVTNCHILNTKQGIYIAGSFNTIEDNFIELSTSGMVFDQNSQNNTLTGNYIQNNTDGLSMIGAGTSQWNLIYDNYFSNLQSNIAIAKDGNIWNTSRIHGMNILGGPIISGNYWSDYLGSDTDGDYIGDTDLPYNSNDAIPMDGDFAPLTLVPICGDVNGDSKINVVDVTYLTNYLFKAGPAPKVNKFSGDVNGDGKVNVVDITYLVNYLFKGGPAPTNCGGQFLAVTSKPLVLETDQATVIASID